MRSYCGLRGVVVILLCLSLLSSVVGQKGLQDYPWLFVQNNALKTKIIVGESASAGISTSAFNLATSLTNFFTDYNADLAQPGATPTGPDETVRYIFEDLELEEPFGEKEESITENDFEELLPDGRISTSEGSTDYTQYLRFEAPDGSIQGGRIVYDEYSDELSDYLLFAQGDVMFEYQIEFEDGLQSDIESGHAEDIEGEVINILGTDYLVLDAGINNNQIQLELLSKDAELLLIEGQPVTIKIGDQSITIEATTISDSSEEVILDVNGETSDALEKGERFTTEDDLHVGIKEVLINEALEISDTGSLQPINTQQFQGMTPAQIQDYLATTAGITGGRDLVSVYVGSQLLEFSDQFNDNTFSRTVHVNDDRLDDGTVKIEGGSSNNEITLDRLTYRAEADPESGNEVYIESENGLRSELQDPQVLINENFDFVYNGLGDVETTEIHFDPVSSDKQYELTFTNRENEECEIPLLDNSNTGSLGFNLGDESNDLFFVECAGGTPCITTSDYLILSTENDHTGTTYVLQYNSFSNNQLTFEDKCSGETITATASNNAGQINIRGSTFSFTVGALNSIAVDLNDDGDIAAPDEAVIVAKGGALIDLGSTNSPTSPFTVTASVEGSLFERDGPFDFGGDESVSISLTSRPGNEVGLLLADQSHLKLNSGDEANVKKGMSPYGALYEYTDDGNNAQELTIDFPEEQLLGSVSLELSPREIVDVAAQVTTPVDIAAFSASPTGIDSDAFSATDNVIVIGNPCTNTVAARLLDSPQPCDAGMRQDIGIIRLFQSGNAYQILVAGKTDEDVRKAMVVLANFEDYQLTGELVQVTGTEANPVVGTASLQDWLSGFNADKQGVIPPTAAAVCSDSIDNDYDGKIDYPQDPGCSSAQDNDETDGPPLLVYQCSDNIDNDYDEEIDYPQDQGCSFAQDNDEMDVVVPPLEEKPVKVEEGFGAGVWIIIGLILVGGAGAALYFVMKKGKKKEEEMPVPEGYTKEQWKQALAYYKEHYPEWYAKYLGWWQQNKPKGSKEMTLVIVLVAVSLLGLAMIITVSWPDEQQVGFAADSAGRAYTAMPQLIICTHIETGVSMSTPEEVSEEQLLDLLCSRSGPWNCVYRGISQLLSCQE